MIVKRILFITVLFMLMVSCVKNESFSYKHQNFWSKHYKTCGSKQRQSPIELFCPDYTVKHYHTRIKYFNYRKNLNVTIENNGHTINITPYKSADYIPPYIKGKILPGKAFAFQSFHFHWGSTNNRGTEHTIKGQRYALEMHIVHKNIKYNSMKEAIKKPDGLVVIGILFKASDLLTDYNSGLRYITWVLKQMTANGSRIRTYNNGFSLMNVLGTLTRNSFFSYNGSLTTPPCSESVTWIVMSHIQTVSSLQMGLFRKLKNNHGEPLSDNYRNLQPIDRRKVFRIN